MGLLDQLWDDTVAGPRPDSGLGRLRKPPAIRVDGADLTCSKGSGGGVCSPGPVSLDRDLMHAHPHVTRSIKIRRPPPVHGVEDGAATTTTTSGGVGTPPLSPATPPPSSPFAGEEKRGGGAGGIGWRFLFRKTVAMPPAPPRDKTGTARCHGRNDNGIGSGGNTPEGHGSPPSPPIL